MRSISKGAETYFFFFMKSHTNYNVIYRVVPCDMCNLIRNYMTRKII